jgi:hypothetical protein
MRPTTTAVLLACLLLASCGSVPPQPDQSYLPPGAFGTNEDQDVAAINFAQYAFADSSRTYGRPYDGARAVASVDYLAGELSDAPRWQFISAITQQDMLQARAAVRQAVGIVPNAPSQAVVNAMVGAAQGLVSGNEAEALAALRSPIFEQPPEQTLQKLANLPYLLIANVATSRAANEMFQTDNDIRFP